MQGLAKQGQDRPGRKWTRAECLWQRAAGVHRTRWVWRYPWLGANRESEGQIKPVADLSCSRAGGWYGESRGRRRGCGKAGSDAKPEQSTCVPFCFWQSPVPSARLARRRPHHCSIPTARPRWLMSCSLVAFTAQASNSRLLCYRSLLAQRAAPNYSSANANACSTSSSSISAVAGGALPYQIRWSTMAADSISHFPFANRRDRCAHRSRSKVEKSHRL